ncbi:MULTISPECIES: ABC transporter permease [Lacticaseibacillus]|uniref:Putative hemin transport system permease protein HrtB n=1 Tax=Lacticaseibacillus casei DSM 20011 = JCM 1134 = ATCC 393 TaxID=1423732 RepID=A0AAD1ANR2_LACCA|nr:ABC transporter permease [Lacticaseibacillus casei]HAJ53642.1 ABC transporter permease [Lactobacillus sp.]MBI6598470.1 ABC transporter permease [Lacticaseibacillus casei]MBO1482139.1 ABC transporter permease [Lacticaseibacillus casei]MBO2417391.1 ABC transporter permease [Lacticaseibacillus casei]MCK2081795.1 ABC transporter permease [Lacticaseibacillus casei]
MYLSLKEIWHEKLRYGLIVAMMLLVTYLVFILSALANGLSQQNTQAINSWDTSRVVLAKDSDINLSQSLLTSQQTKDLNLGKSQAYVGTIGVVATSSKHDEIRSTMIGLDWDQYIGKDMKLVSGHRAQSDHQIVVDSEFKDKGYALGDKVKLSTKGKRYTIVGFTENAKMSVAPVVYGTMNAWRTLHNLPNTFTASGIVSKSNNFKVNTSDLKTYSANTFIQKLPGYSAQNSTFTFMIGFLFVISLIVIAVFLYILTMQKLPNYAVLRAQGVPSRTLVITTIAQALILVTLGLALGGALTAITAQFMPMGVPMIFSPQLNVAIVIGILLTGFLGSIIPIRTILKVDPVTAIGG